MNSSPRVARLSQVLIDDEGQLTRVDCRFARRGVGVDEVDHRNSVVLRWSLEEIDQSGNAIGDHEHERFDKITARATP
ncbi:MAG: hypothetical protein ACI8W3_003255 [Myxococcota bacterium]|jgi:hypothetical protein